MTYLDNLKCFFTEVINDRRIYDALSAEEKIKIRSYRYLVKKNLSVSESLMRRTIEKHLRATISITLPYPKNEKHNRRIDNSGDRLERPDHQLQEEGYTSG